MASSIFLVEVKVSKPEKIDVKRHLLLILITDLQYKFVKLDLLRTIILAPNYLIQLISKSDSITCKTRNAKYCIKNKII